MIQLNKKQQEMLIESEKETKSLGDNYSWTCIWLKLEVKSI